MYPPTHSTLCEIHNDRSFTVKFLAATTTPVTANVVAVVLDGVGAVKAFENHVTAETVVTFTMSTDADAAVRSGISGWTTLTALAGSDPVAVSGGVARKFSLPPGRLVPLLTSPDMSLHGATFEGMGPWEQWFDRMVIFSAQRDRWLQIGIKKDIWTFNRSQNAHDAFETLEVVAGHGDIDDPQPGASADVPSNFDLPLGFLGVNITFRLASRHHKVPTAMIGRARRECGDIMGETLHFLICSAPANEYFGWQRHLAIQFAHLDIVLLEVLNPGDVDGLLPQLWGVKPLSDENAAYLDEVAPQGASSANESTSQSPEVTGLIGSATPPALNTICTEPEDEVT